ncbi:MAG: bifunctional oligoribonuclease/PAP phosphatase NrnA [Muribaculaceae bacterium]|nr:bifunctional oligoribonuclease/PAP phosphatase NrnA [Muribaculaceae bacterium]
MKSLLNPDSVKEFMRLVATNERIVLTCHMRPDGDALGSVLGLWHLLRNIGKDVNVVIPDRAPRNLMFLPGSRDMVVFTQYDPYCNRLVDEAGLIIMCDFNTADRQGNLAPLIQSAKCSKVLIDHHREPDLNCDVIFSRPEMSSTCELVFRLLAACGWYEQLDKPGATCILTGLITDTRNFSVNCNNPEIYEILMRLLEKDVDKKYIIEEALNTTTVDALRLNSFALLDRLEIFTSHRCALITLSAEDLRNHNYQKGDTEGLVNIPLGIRGIVYSIYMREDADCIKVSSRSKYDFPVCDICKDLFNGGGHLMAAGGEFIGSLEECRATLIAHLGDYDSHLPSHLPKIELSSVKQNYDWNSH